MCLYLFLDESGDLGFDFADKNPSRFLTITVLATEGRSNAQSIRNAVKKTLRRKVHRRKRDTQNELKGSQTSISVKRHFYNQVKGVEFKLYAVSLDKRKVAAELTVSPSKKDRLYNFVAGAVIGSIPFASSLRAVEVIVDRSKRKDAAIEFNKTLQAQLEGRLSPAVRLRFSHFDSAAEHGLNAVDLFCWGIARKRERGDSEWFDCYSDKVALDELYQ